MDETEEFLVITVAILGKKNDRRITDYLIRIFENVCPCLFLTPFGTIRTTKTPWENGPFEPSILFYDCESTFNHCTPDIILLKDSEESMIPLLKENTTVIFNATNFIHLEMIRGISVRTISCGTSERDTITFSSTVSEQPVLSLQRTIQTTENEEIEPFELPIQTDSTWARYPLQCVFALLVLLGIPEQIHAVFHNTPFNYHNQEKI